MKSDAVDSSITSGERRFVLLWALALVLVYAALGVYTVTTVSGYRSAAIARHQARIDAKAVEPGRTAVEDTLPPDAHPRQVTVGMYLDGIASISILDSGWEPVFYIWFRWAGDDLDPGETFNVVDGEILSREKLSSEVVNGEHYAVYLVRAKVTKFFTADRFPVDDHLLTIAIEDGRMTWEALEYVADTANSNLSSRVKMPGYRVYKSGLVVKPHAYKTSFGDPRRETGSRKTFSQLMYGVWNARPGFGPYFKIFVGLFAAVSIALLAFFIKPTDVDPRFGLGVGGFFGAVANTLIAASLVPDSGTLTLMDLVNGVGMVTIFLTLVQSTISLHLYDVRERTALSKLFDRVSLWVFVAGFVVINALIPWAGLVK
jgi:hypothetical protein